MAQEKLNDKEPSLNPRFFEGRRRMLSRKLVEKSVSKKPSKKKSVNRITTKR